MSKIVISLSVVFSILGLIIFIVFLLNISNDFSICGGQKISFDKTGQFGDFIGGVVGSIWTFVSVLLFYNALQLQREELKETRKQMDYQLTEMKRQSKEFEVNRISNVIYKQLEIIELKGNNLFFKLDSRKINAKGLASIHTFKIFFPFIAKYNTKFSDFTQDEIEDINTVLTFLVNQHTKEFIMSVENTLSLILNIIDDNQILMIDQREKEHLFGLCYYNYDLENLIPFFREYQRFFKLQIEKYSLNGNVNNFGYEKQEIRRSEKIIELMRCVKKGIIKY